MSQQNSQQAYQQQLGNKLVKLEHSASEILKRIIKYILEGLAVALAARFIPNQPMDLQSVIMLGLVAAATFALLDIFAPTISLAARQGAGFAVGVNRIGGGFASQ